MKILITGLEIYYVKKLIEGLNPKIEVISSLDVDIVKEFVLNDKELKVVCLLGYFPGSKKSNPFEDNIDIMKIIKEHNLPIKVIACTIHYQTDCELQRLGAQRLIDFDFYQMRNVITEAL